MAASPSRARSPLPTWPWNGSAISSLWDKGFVLVRLFQCLPRSSLLLEAAPLLLEPDLLLLKERLSLRKIDLPLFKGVAPPFIIARQFIRQPFPLLQQVPGI